MNDVEEGGETAFPKIGADGWGLKVKDSSQCRGLKVKPKANQCVLWYNLLPEGQHNGTIDPFSTHMGCDVLKGEKWGANKWIANKYYVE